MRGQGEEMGGAALCPVDLSFIILLRTSSSKSIRVLAPKNHHTSCFLYNAQRLQYARPCDQVERQDQYRATQLRSKPGDANAWKQMS